MRRWIVLSGAPGGIAMDLKIPTPLTIEHEELHAELVALTREPGTVGAAARRVAGLLHPHFVKEEEYDALAAAGRAESRPDAVRFAEKLRLHAEVEEQVLYPTAILVGREIKARLAA